ncbi:D-alanyl-D-alanine carboxypeptidase [Candidatus Borreliella tachyglossi]|uniref:serine-type D-Ala-D-Ala carboxypeptidase n=1 Tax=Candidatus Borreliella tachyglossi TaxID=1964448 RepID=A0A2S1LXC9_9SPIR|nr:D-alanyl-D-alanine carboxypeptidase family protein [Candidatus Borreliella tachyglossi]AWG42967.1 D-alanyl-D-alanine carboxypeptidase [Candidatus Borreliella tachyglossi]
MKTISTILKILMLSGDLFSINLFELERVTEYAESAVLLDYDTNRVLYAKNPNSIFPPASLTKLVTIYTALIEARKKNIDFKSNVPISSFASYYNAPLNSSLMFLEEGQRVTFEELLKGLAIASGNDAAIAIAEFIVRGSLSNFINLMNINVLNLGLVNMHFVDTSGYSSDNKTTALEMALFAKAYIDKFGFMMNIHSLKSFIYPKLENLGNTSYSKVLNLRQENKNVLILNYPYADGLKTGYIGASGLNLVATAKRGDRRLIAVVLGVKKEVSNIGEKKRALVAQRLFEYGFNNYSKFSFMVKSREKIYNGVVDMVDISSKESFKYVFSKDEVGRVRVESNIKELIAPLSDNVVVGKATIFLDDSKLGELDLFGQCVERLGFFNNVYKFFFK